MLENYIKNLMNNIATATLITINIRKYNINKK